MKENASTDIIRLKIFQTTDVHGNFLNYNFINNRSYRGGLGKVYTYVSRQRRIWGEDNCILLDGGDVLEGQPCAYYANFIALEGIHHAADIMNYMRYDAAVFGNHDFEVGPSVYKRWVGDCKFPVLGANVHTKPDGEVFTVPYTIIHRQGLKIAVLGLTTSAVPMWLSDKLWKGLEFQDIVESASRWTEHILENEHPDLMIGLFHTGLDQPGINGFNENAAREIARDIPGFDIIFFGHDHQAYKGGEVNKQTGREVVLLNAGGATMNVAEAVVTIQRTQSETRILSACGQLVSIQDYPVSYDFVNRYSEFKNQVVEHFSRSVGQLALPVKSSDYFFGPSSVGDILHAVLIRETGADISLAAPLTYTEDISSGTIYARDIFKLYRYENYIDLFRLTGSEIRSAIDYSYSLFTDTEDSCGKVINIIHPYNRYIVGAFSPFLVTAAGIKYEVDLSSPPGKKVTILSMLDGSPFHEHKIYKVAVNSYIGSGGGGILTDGTGLTMNQLGDRLISTSENDIRSLITELVQDSPSPFVPPRICMWKYTGSEEQMRGLADDRQLLFGRRKKKNWKRHYYHPHTD